MEYKNLNFILKDYIATISFNRPKALNALNFDTLDEFSDILDRINEDESIRVLIVTGSGDKAFVAGADITELATFSSLESKAFAFKGQTSINKLQDIRIPVIGAVNGFALGGGIEIALACDFIYASENAKFGLPEINLGLIPGFGGTQRLSRLIGKNLAKEMIFTGKMLTAEQAREIGIVNLIYSQESLMDEVLKTAKIITSKGKFSLSAAKKTINSGMDVDLATGLGIENDAFALCFANKDAKEGTTAFIEKRKAEFKGSYTG